MLSCYTNSEEEFLELLKKEHIIIRRKESDEGKRFNVDIAAQAVDIKSALKACVEHALGRYLGHGQGDFHTIINITDGKRVDIQSEHN